MIKKLLILVLVFGLALTGHAQTPALGTHTGILASWTAPVGVACSSSVTTACVKGYTETVTPPAGVPGVNIVSVGLVSSYTWKPGGNLYCGTWMVSLVANWLDGSGNAVASAPVTATAVEPCPFVPSPVMGLSIKAQ